MSTFHADLERGLAVERMVLEVIRKKYPCAVQVDKFKGYDLWIPEIHKSIEVKYDEMSNETGNICVEVEMNGKASGLSTSTADFWVFFDGSAMLFISTDHIKECLLTNNLTFRCFVGTGDSVGKKAYLIDKELLKTFAATKERK
jgi:hypothetical protein